MQSIKWLAILIAGLIIVACFFTWVSIEDKNFFIGGFYSSTASTFGKPGLFHLIFCSLYVLLLLLNRIWSVRAGFFISAFNLAWAIRNFAVISACSGGVCPQKHTAIYTILIGSILLLVASPFIKVKTTR
jgi:hypothetical protein